MNAPAKYRIVTLDDIATIPDEALPRFLAELPAILKAREEVREAIPALAAQARANARGFSRFLPVSAFERVLEHQLLTKGTWVDDDKATVTVTMAMKAGDEPFYRQTEPLEPRS